MVKKVVIPFIHCYGHWDVENRHPIEMVGLKQYLRGIRQFLDDLDSLGVCRFEPLHFVGGAEKDGKTEAESIKHYWSNDFRGPKDGTPQPVLGGLNHLECADEVAQVFDQLKESKAVESDSFPIYFVDAVRAELVRYILSLTFEAMELRPWDGNEMVVGIPRHDTSPCSTVEFQMKQLAHFRETGEFLPITFL